MAEFKTLDDAAFRKAAARGRRLSAAPRATAVHFDVKTSRLVVQLDTGLDLSFDPRQAHGLQDATDDDFIGAAIEGAGIALHLPRLDADFSIARLLEGFLGPLDWTQREARAAASRENGKRGGRPRRATSVAP
jgi:hypothetical protein